LNSLQLADIAKVEAAITVSENTGPNTIGSGTANWTYNVADKAFDFLAAGETLTLTYTATVDNNYQPLDQTGTQTITITVTGTNDAPVITSPQQNVSFAPAGTDTKGGDLIPNTATQGTLNFTDADLTDTHTVAVKMASALLNGQSFAATVGQAVIDELSTAVTASLSSNGAHDSTLTGTGTISWTLANLQVYLADLIPAGETLVLTYAVTVTDSQGVTSTQDIVVTIGGNNEPVLAWIDTSPIPPGGALWSTALNWEGDLTPDVNHDVVINNNQVSPKTPTFPVTVNADASAKSLTMTDFSDGIGVPTLDVEANVTLTIAGALNLNTDRTTDPDTGAPLVLPTAEAIINNYGTISVGGIATLLKQSALNNFGTITLAEGGVFGDQSSVTNSGTITFVEAGNFEDLGTVANSNTIIFDNGGNFVEQSIV
jgi:VCBS repeat-containing protein